MEELIDSIYINYDAWSRCWILGLIGVCAHWGILLKSFQDFWPTIWYICMAGNLGILISLIILKVIDQSREVCQYGKQLQKYIMFFYGPVLFLLNWFAFFSMIDQMISSMPFSMLEWCFLLAVSLYNLYSFLLIHYSKNVGKKYSFLLEIN